MSRSYRHSSYTSITCSGYRRGEKDDKIRWHQKDRSKTKSILSSVNSIESALEIKSFPHKNDEEVYKWRKDGKWRLKCPKEIKDRGNDGSLHWTKDGKLRK